MEQEPKETTMVKYTTAPYEKDGFVGVTLKFETPHRAYSKIHEANKIIEIEFEVKLESKVKGKIAQVDDFNKVLQLNSFVRSEKLFVNNQTFERKPHEEFPITSLLDGILLSNCTFSANPNKFAPYTTNVTKKLKLPLDLFPFANMHGIIDIKYDVLFMNCELEDEFFKYKVKPIIKNYELEFTYSSMLIYGEYHKVKEVCVAPYHEWMCLNDMKSGGDATLNAISSEIYVKKSNGVK